MSESAPVGKLRRVPATMRHPYLVIGPSNERLGLVGEPVLVAKLLAADFRATCTVARRGVVYLADLDAWLTLYRTFELRDYLPQSWVCRKRTSLGRMYYDLIPARRIIRYIRAPDSRHPGRAVPGRRKKRPSRPARKRLRLTATPVAVDPPMIAKLTPKVMDYYLTPAASAIADATADRLLRLHDKKP